MAKEKRPIIYLEPVPSWLVTFGDMMSLLLTFFILLFSISEIKEPGRIFDLVQTFHAKLNSPRPVIGYTLPRHDMGPDGMLNDLLDMPNQMGETGVSSNRVLNSEGDSIYARTIRDNLHLQFKGTVHFREGGSFLLEKGRQVLKEYVVPAVIDGRFKIVILGHAALGEASTRDGEYALGFERALEIRKYLVANGIPAQRIELQSAGSRVTARNEIDNEAVRHLRRRVDVLISPQIVGPPAEG
jgi:chemotaxis protein MotB